jgi:hypothetical protein
MATTISPTAPEQTEAKKPRKRREVDRKPLWLVEEGVKLSETPADFDPEKFRLLRKHFVDIPAWMEHQAWVHEISAKRLRNEAAEYRLNPPAKQGGAKRAKLQSRLAKLEAKLAELGVNIADLFDDESE